jgi:hypothetical protein
VMVGRALVMMVPSRADTSPVTMRDTMMAQKRHVRMVALVFVATGVSGAWLFIGSVLCCELSKTAVCEVVCCSTGSRSCVVMVAQSGFVWELDVCCMWC